MAQTSLQAGDFSLLLSLSYDLYSVVGPDRLIVEVSGAWKGALGYDPAEARGKTISYFIHPDDQAVTEDYAVNYVRAGKPYPGPFENRLLAKSGEVKWFRWQTRFANGMVYAVARDITEEKAAQTHAQLAETRLATVIDGLHDPFFVVDSDLKFVYLNQSAELRLKSKRQEVIGRPINEVLQSTEDSDFYQVLQEVVATGCPKQCELYRSERAVHHVANLYPVVGGVAIHLSDVSERAKINEQLKIAKERLELALEAGHMGYWDADLSNRSGYYWNAAAEIIFGYPPTGGRHSFEDFRSRVHPEDWSLIEHSSRAALNGEHPQTQFRVVWPDGRVRWVQGYMRAIFDTNGVPSRLIGINLDITEQKETERKLIENDKLVAMGTLAAGVAHEINNPLTYVMTNLDLLLERISVGPGGVASLNGPQAVESLKKINEGVRRIEAVVKDLRTLSRRDDDKATAADLSKAIEVAASMAWNEIRHRAQFNKSIGKLPRVYGNESRLTQVFLNLFINAAQAMQDGRAHENIISVSTRVNEAGDVVVDVSDTGCGISPENMNRLFEPFFTTKPKGTGTGLGLSICRNILKGYGSKIDVRSEPGRGSTFTVTLKPALKIPSQQRGHTLRFESSRGTRAKILLIDDEDLLLESVAESLSKFHDVKCASGAQVALEILSRDQNFDVIITDLMMPDMTGIDLYEKLRAKHQGLENRVIFMTGGAFTTTAVQFLSQVPNLRLEKPFTRQKIQEVIMKCLAARHNDALKSAA